MSDTNQIQDDWNEMIEQMNEAVADSVEQNMEAQAAFMESWTDAFDFEESMPDEDAVAESIEAYNSAYDVWMDAAEQMFERTTDAAEGEDVDPTEFRDIMLKSANEAFKEVMSTSAFASANGQLVESMMEMQQQVDEVTQDTIARMGMPTRDDVEEIGDRLIELERRQHSVEDKLDDEIGGQLDDLIEGQTAAEGQLDDIAQSNDAIEQRLEDEISGQLGNLIQGQDTVEEQLDDISQSNDAIEQRLEDEISGELGNLIQRQNAIEEKLDDLAEGQDAVESQLADEDVDDQLEELSQRQNDVEDKLDRVLDALEE